MRGIIVLLLFTNVGLGLTVVYRQKMTNDLKRTMASEQAQTIYLQREHDQLRSELHSVQSNLEDQLITHNRLNMRSPAKERGVIDVNNARRNVPLPSSH